MGKVGKRQKKDTRNPKRRTRDEDSVEENMDDEIDAFHKHRDIIPLDVEGNLGASDEDNEQPVFDFEEFDEDEDANDNDDDDEIGDDAQLTGLAAKIARQQKFLQQKIGGVEDDMHEEAEEEEEKKSVWGRRKDLYYSAENVDYELQSSDEDLPAEEEAEVLRLQREKAKSLSMEDFGLEDIDHDESGSDRERTLEDLLPKVKARSKPHAVEDTEDDTGTAYEEVKKDLNALSREEQMEVVYSSAPELVGLLSELNDALDQLESKVNPLLSKVKEQNTTKGGMHYLKVKQLLLLSYCQAISFYLLLKSEGHPVRDHPVIGRLVEIKNMLDKMKQLDESLPSEIEEILNQDHGMESEANQVKESVALASAPVSTDREPSSITLKSRKATLMQPDETAELLKVGLSKDSENKKEKRKRQADQVGQRSMEMLKVRANLEEKLKQKGIFSSILQKPDRTQKHLVQPVNRQFETFDDFGDEVIIDKEGGTYSSNNGLASSLRLSKLPQLGTTKVNKSKVISGDDDLPKRDDIGERRRKHELRVLSKAGVEPIDEVGDEFETLRGIGAEPMNADVDEDGGTEESEDEFYKQVKLQRAAKLSAKAELYSRTPVVPSMTETEVVDGKRLITYQIEKNRGLTRARKKLTKNPRKKYKLKHQKAVVRRKGQVREVKRPSGPYGGEVSGINAGISRSIRFKS